MTKHCLHELLDSSRVFDTGEKVETVGDADNVGPHFRDRLPHGIRGESAGENHLVARKVRPSFTRQI